MRREGKLTERLISEENLLAAIREVNRTHRRGRHCRPNRCVLWVERTMAERVQELRNILLSGFTPSPARRRTIWDVSSQKEREIYEPKLWPDQYVHHALIQVIQPIIMRSMDHWNCGSIPGRGPHYGKKGIEKWMRTDKRGTKYCAQLDIRRFYQSLRPEIVMARMERLIKDKLVLRLIRDTLKDGVPIGSYCSQWYANAVLEPLDRLIRTVDGVSHYVRYMDNLTLFGPNKRKLHRAVQQIAAWLEAHRLALKGDWQVFPTKARMPDAMGFRYGRGYTLPRKKNLLRFRRACARIRRRIRSGRQPTAKQARGLLSRKGGLICCRAFGFLRRWYAPIGEKRLKRIVRNAA